MDDTPHKTLRHGLSMAILSHNTLVKKTRLPTDSHGFYFHASGMGEYECLSDGSHPK